MSVLGLIPAKGGSRRLARKNVRMLAGRPLLAWAAEAARASGILDRLIVSTEDAEVAETARRLGLDVPFMRPPELARDPAGVSEVASHALDVLEGQGAKFETLVILLPTCPLRTADDIRGAYDMFHARGAKFLLSVAPYHHTPFSALSLDAAGEVTAYFPDIFWGRSRDLPAAYRPNGAVHVLDVAAFRAQGTYCGTPLFAYPMPAERSIDIDNEIDLQHAEAVQAARGAVAG